jgi:hypothetical protein
MADRGPDRTGESRPETLGPAASRDHAGERQPSEQRHADARPRTTRASDIWFSVKTVPPEAIHVRGRAAP